MEIEAPNLENGYVKMAMYRLFHRVSNFTARSSGSRPLGDNVTQRRPVEPARPLSVRAIVLGTVAAVVVAIVAFVGLIYLYGDGTDRDQAQLDVVRTAGTLVLGTGGAVALLLTARRQRYTELTLEHQREVAAASAHDAAERHITELYSRAVDQLGNEQAPVRLGGLHALERLAQDNPTKRQTIVDVICAYLRMPYARADDEPPDDEAPAEAHSRYERRRQELQVRLTAQRILGVHLNPDIPDSFWPNIDLDLTEARLHGFDLTHCSIRKAQFRGARFFGLCNFAYAQFSGFAHFEETRFSGFAQFTEAHFCGPAEFPRARFVNSAGFTRVRFAEMAAFAEAEFVGDTFFTQSKFADEVRFDGAIFSGEARFEGAYFCEFAGFAEVRFDGAARFSEARFSHDAAFEEAEFSGEATFDGAQARLRTDSAHSWPATWTTTRKTSNAVTDAEWLDLIPAAKQ